jgi:hypothetical protein
MPISSSSSPEPLRNNLESASHTDDSSTHFTPSDNDSDDGLPMIDGTDTYELQPIPEVDDVRPQGRVQEEGASLLPTSRQYSRSSAQSFELYTPDEDKQVLRKLDRRLVGFVALLYCLSFLDRSSEYISAQIRYVQCRQLLT